MGPDIQVISLHKIKQRLFGGHERTVRANKNIFYSFFIKGTSIASQLMLVPLTLHYLDKTQYGIWLTLASIMGWFSFFDIGIGNGLRNKLSEALAKDNLILARTYISTSYALVAVIFLSLMVIFWIINPFINWAQILNTPESLQLELSKMVLFVFSFFCLQFILNLIGNVFFAKQLSAFNNLIGPLGSLLSMVIIYILTLTTKGSLFWVAVTFSAVPVLVLLIFNIIFFSNKFRDISPSIKHVNFKHSKNLLGLGVQFFIIQVAGIILFTSSNIIITQLYGPGEVAVYNIAYKYFAIVMMIQGIITTPFWSAITEAYVKKDMAWIRRTIKKLELIGLGLVVISTIMLLVAKPVYDLWLGNAIQVPLSMNLMACLFVSISVMGRPYNTFVNGIGRVRLQLYSAVISIIITIPLAILFAKTLNLGGAGVVLATVCTTLPTTLLWRIQYKKILAGTARGIWNK
ncbi:MAG TPA: MATE family efflux transporter [Ohtaekwangia sp.]|nr:MATE family efflux transporter [Ohtaekwangia sp.]